MQGNEDGIDARTCKQVVHSRTFNIMSLFNVPGRRAFRKVGRAFTFGIVSVTQGYSLRNLSRGKKLVSQEVEEQLHRKASHARTHSLFW